MRTAGIALAAAIALPLLSLACKDKDQPTVDAGGLVATTPEAAAPTGTCLPCSASGPTSWFFYRQFADAQCTKPIAQAMVDACADVNVPAQLEVTYGDPWKAKKYGEKTTADKLEEVASNAGVYRLIEGGQCVPADTAALKLVPAGCAGKKVCRNDAGELVCDGCRTLSNGCPAYEPALARVVFADKGAPPAGGGGNTNVARLKQCCNQLAIQAKAMPNSPEGGLFQQAAAQCNAMASALGPNANAPELGAIKTLLAGRNIPAVCAGF